MRYAILLIVFGLSVMGCDDDDHAIENNPDDTSSSGDGDTDTDSDTDTDTDTDSDSDSDSDTDTDTDSDSDSDTDTDTDIDTDSDSVGNTDSDSSAIDGGTPDSGDTELSELDCQSIHIEGTNYDLHRGQTSQLFAYCELKSGDRIEITNEVKWYSSFPIVVSVSDSGSVYALDDGTVTITALYNDLSDSVVIRVLSCFTGRGGALFFCG